MDIERMPQDNLCNYGTNPTKGGEKNHIFGGLYNSL